MISSSRIALEAINIGKRFGDLVALDGVSLKLQAGTIHALLGENGAGKSTLVKCIMGYHRPTEGEVMVGDRQQIIDNPQAAMLSGIGMVYQHFTLISNMTVAENLVLARPRLPGVINWDKEMRELERRVVTMPFPVPLNKMVSQLAAGEKQKIEIVKQLIQDIKILILDEPTSVLTPSEADEVLTQIRGMTRAHGLSVLIITHKFREVMQFADEVTVLRRGRYVGSARVNETTPPQLAAMMMGQEEVKAPLQRNTQMPSKELLCVSEFQVNDDIGKEAVAGLSISVRAGEIVGVAGVSGNGQRELVQSLSGQRHPVGGKMVVGGEAYHAQRKEMSRHRFYCLPEEPLRNACVPNMTVAENLAFRNFDKSPLARRGGLLNRGAMRRQALPLIERFSIRTPSADTPIGNLSGGNVQRAVLARELSGDVDVLVVANPCFGLDFKATADIRQQIMAARNRGTAVLLVSEDLDEILELSDRVLVMSGGKVVYETTPQQADRAVIGQHMAGH